MYTTPRNVVAKAGIKSASLSMSRSAKAPCRMTSCTTVDLASLKFLQRSNWPGDIWINVDMGHHVQSPGTKNCAQ